MSRTDPLCSETPSVSPRPRKFRVCIENCPKKPSSSLQPPPKSSSVRSDSSPLTTRSTVLVSLFGGANSIGSSSSSVKYSSCRILSRLLRSEEHTSELQSRLHLVCRLLLEKKNKTK